MTGQENVEQNKRGLMSPGTPCGMLMAAARRALRRFAGDERGSIVTTFGYAIVPLMMIGGAAIDLSRATNADAKLQQAADSAMLAIGRNEKSTTDVAKLKQLATAHMTAMLPEDYDFEVTSITRESGKISLAATGSVPAGISGIFGIEEIDQSAASEVMWGAASEDGTVGRLEVALVLDNTGSMAQYNRMTEMKKAATALLDELQTSDPGLVKVSIVPFDTSVRVATSYKTATWFKGDWWVNWFWKGCLTDRDQPYDVGDAPATSTATKYPAALCDSNSLATILPLTDSFPDLYGKVNAMSPAGNTNITIGLSWGLTMLSAQEPFTQGAASGTPGLRKIMVLMTDGANTKNRWNDTPAEIDARTTLACQSVKDAGIQLYTVRLMEGTPSLLQACASSDETFYDVEDVDDLVPTFKAIGQELSQLRLSR